MLRCRRRAQQRGEVAGQDLGRHVDDQSLLAQTRDRLKARVLAACDGPGASVAAIARAYDLNANLVHKWRRGVTPTAGPPASSRAGYVAGEFIALALPSREHPRPLSASGVREETIFCATR